MKNLLTIALIIATASAQAQFKTTRKVSAHSSIVAATGIVVEYINSNKNELIIETEKKEFIELISTDVKNGQLEIRYKPNSKINSKKASTVKVYSNSVLQEAKASSSATLILKDPINTRSIKLDAHASGSLATNEIQASIVKIACSSSAKMNTTVDANQLTINVSSSSKVTGAGKAENVNVNMSSSSTTNLENLNIDNLTINGSSSSKLFFYTANTLSSALSSSAQVYYTKAPNKITKNIMSSSGRLSQK